MPKQLVRICPSDRFCRAQNLPTSSVELIWPITEIYFRQILATDFMNRFYLDAKTGPNTSKSVYSSDSQLLLSRPSLSGAYLKKYTRKTLIGYQFYCFQYVAVFLSRYQPYYFQYVAADVFSFFGHSCTVSIVCSTAGVFFLAIKSFRMTEST